MKIDDMRVGDFFHLMDCMQEECCESTCPNCRYNDFCYVDMSSIDSSSIERTVEGYAESNELIDHMHYVNDQKWISVNERLPDDGESVLTCKNGRIEIQEYEKRRNGWVQGNWFWSMATVTHWMPLPKPFRGQKND